MKGDSFMQEIFNPDDTLSVKNIQKVVLSNSEVFVDKNELFLRLEYNVFFKDGQILRYVFPKVFIKLRSDKFTLFHDTELANLAVIERGGRSHASYPLEDDDFNHKYRFMIKVIKEADEPKEMTLGEIEKKLGYKVKIVNDK